MVLTKPNITDIRIYQLFKILMAAQAKKKDDDVVVPFQIAWDDEVQELQTKKKRIQEIMDFIKEEWLDQDTEFMKEVREAIEDGL